jgi:hypothetical protein
METEMIATAYGKVQVDQLRDAITEIGLEAGTRRILYDGLNCVTTLNSSNVQSDSRHLRLRHHTIHEAIAKAEIEVKHVPADALTKALGE